jgi:hypothetical protein
LKKRTKKLLSVTGGAALALLWALHNPLQCVAVLAGVSVLIGLFLVPRLREITDHGHPRC